MLKRKIGQIDYEKPNEENEKEKDRKKSRIDETSVEEDDSAFAIFPDETFLYLLGFVGDVDLYRLLMVSKRCKDIATAAIEERYAKAIPHYRDYKKLYFNFRLQPAKSAAVALITLAEDGIPRLCERRRSVLPNVVYYEVFDSTILNNDELVVLKFALAHLKEEKKFRRPRWYQEMIDSLLHFFIGTMNYEVINILLSENANLHKRDVFGNTPIITFMYVLCFELSSNYPTDEGLQRLLKLFLAYEVDFNILNNNGDGLHALCKEAVNSVGVPDKEQIEDEGDPTELIIPIMQVFAFLYHKEVFTTISEEEFKTNFIQEQFYIELYEAEKAKIEGEIVCDNAVSFKLN